MYEKPFATSVSSIAPPMHPSNFPFDAWLPVMGPYNCADLHKIVTSYTKNAYNAIIHWPLNPCS